MDVVEQSLSACRNTVATNAAGCRRMRPARLNSVRNAAIRLMMGMFLLDNVS